MTGPVNHYSSRHSAMGNTSCYESSISFYDNNVNDILPFTKLGQKPWHNIKYRKLGNVDNDLKDTMWRFTVRGTTNNTVADCRLLQLNKWWYPLVMKEVIPEGNTKIARGVYLTKLPDNHRGNVHNFLIINLELVIIEHIHCGKVYSNYEKCSSRCLITNKVHAVLNLCSKWTSLFVVLGC